MRIEEGNRGSKFEPGWRGEESTTASASNGRRRTQFLSA
jgi:hypothetical protein